MTHQCYMPHTSFQIVATAEWILHKNADTHTHTKTQINDNDNA